MEIDPLYLILISVCSGIGVELGKSLFAWSHERWKKHKENAKKLGQHLGSYIPKIYK